MKPLIVLRVPRNLNYVKSFSGRGPELYHLWEMFDSYVKAETKGDYYVLTFLKDDSEDMEFDVEVFNATNIPEIEVERLQAQIHAQIRRYKPTPKDDKDNILRSEP